VSRWRALVLLLCAALIVFGILNLRAPL
jgi:hypothetical protein